MLATAEQVGLIYSALLSLILSPESKNLFHYLPWFLVLGRIAPSGNGIEEEGLTVDQNSDNEIERKRVLNEHPPAEAQNVFARSRLFGNASVTRCELRTLSVLHSSSI
jgi:hypothetical protein